MQTTIEFYMEGEMEGVGPFRLGKRVGLDSFWAANLELAGRPVEVRRVGGTWIQMSDPWVLGAVAGEVPAEVAQRLDQAVMLSCAALGLWGQDPVA